MVGDRWTLLIVRELALRGACRPVLDDLTRWGPPLISEQKPGDAVRSHWLAGALELLLTGRQPDAPP